MCHRRAERSRAGNADYLINGACQYLHTVFHSRAVRFVAAGGKGVPVRAEHHRVDGALAATSTLVDDEVILVSQ